MAQKQQKPKIDLDPTGPIHFEWPVKIPTVSGKALEITFTYLYRTRKERAALAEERVARAKEKYEADLAKAKAEEAAAQTLAEESGEEAAPDANIAKLFDVAYVKSLLEQLDNEVEQLMEIAVGWDVPGYEFNVENLTKLCDLHETAPNAIATQYRVALTEGRLGN